MIGRQWDGAPRSVRAVVLVAVLAVAYGTVVHVVHLVTGGSDPYPALPVSLRAYFLALTVFDPLAAVLLARQLRCGVVLAVVVLVSDAVVNGYANYILDSDPGLTLGRVGHAVITVLAVTMLVTAASLWRFSSARSPKP